MVATLLGLLLVSSAKAAQTPMPGPGIYLNSDGAPIIPMIVNAQRSIDIEIYTMDDPGVRTLLRNALKRGVQVRIIKEPSPEGASCKVFDPPGADNADCADQKNLVSQVRAAGGTYEPYNKQNLCPHGGSSPCFEHGKIALVDGNIAMISTGNFDSTNLCIASENPSRCDRDYSLVVDDSNVVSTLENLFEADIKAQSYDPRTLIPSDLQGLLIVSPYALQPLVDFINTARSTLDIETQYLKDPILNNAIIAAARRGVQVNVTTASACAFGKPKASEINQVTKVYSAFDKAGISSSMFNASNQINGRPGYLHAKAIIVDGTRAWVGSTNGSTTSLTENREYGLVVDGGSVPGLLGVVRADHDSSNSETWSDSLNCAKDQANIDQSSSLPQDVGTVTVPMKKRHRH